MTEEEKTTQKPGVRTKLNSGSNKVKLRDNSKSKKGAEAAPNPTAAAATQKLPSMKLSTETNWAEETSNSVLNAVTPVSSKRSLGDSRNLPVTVGDTSVTVIPEHTEPVQVKEVKKEPKNKYKKKKDKNGNLIDDIKNSITQGIDSIKVDYEQLAQIQSELQGSAEGMKTKLSDRVNRIKEYANTAVAASANVVEEIRPKKQNNYDVPKEQFEDKKPKSKQKQKAETSTPKPSDTNDKPIINQSEVSVDEVKEAAAMSMKTEKVVDKDLSQKLNQAIQRRNGAKNALNALNTQLQYATGEKKKSLQDRIKQKEKQLEEAQAVIDELSSQEQE